MREEFRQRNGLRSDGGRRLVTGETTASFKGYYRAAGGDALFERAFLKFDGEGETANARERAIGGHPAVLLRGVCRRKDPSSPHADPDGYVPFGKLVDYVAGRSDGCTSWSASDAAAIMAMVRNDPTTLYIYPESRDIDAVARAVQAGEAPSRAGLYWNAACLKDRRSEDLAEGNARADPCAMARGASRSAAAATADLQGALRGCLQGVPGAGKKADRRLSLREPKFEATAGGDSRNRVLAGAGKTKTITEPR